MKQANFSYKAFFKKADAFKQDLKKLFFFTDCWSDLKNSDM